MQAIKTIGLTKRYKNLTAVDALNLEIRQGELFALLGVNGAGKTTAIKMLSCLTKPTDGEAIVGGYSVTKETEQVKRRIGVSPQETAIAPNLWCWAMCAPAPPAISSARPRSPAPWSPNTA